MSTKNPNAFQTVAVLIAVAAFFCLDAYLIAYAVNLFRPGTLTFLNSLVVTYALGAVGTRVFKR